MLTDAQLLSKVNVVRYNVTVCEIHDRVPRVTLGTDAKNMKEARLFGNEYAARILGLGVRSYFLLIEKAGK